MADPIWRLNGASKNCNLSNLNENVCKGVLGVAEYEYEVRFAKSLCLNNLFKQLIVKTN